MESMENVEKGATMFNMNTNNELLTVIRELTEANEELIRASENNEFELLPELLNKVSLLEQRRNRVIHNTQSARQGARVSCYEPAIPLRDQVIRALNVVSSPTSGKLLTDVTKAYWDEHIETKKLSSLRRDEARSWLAGHDTNRRTAIRDVYVVPALSYDRFAPVRGVLALSSWDLAKRLIAPLSPRVDMLQSTIALAVEAERLSDTSPGERLKRLVGRLGASIPGVRAFGATPQEVRAAAEAELSEIREIDKQERATAAERAKAQLDEESVLFGAPLKIIQHGAIKRGS